MTLGFVGRRRTTRDQGLALARAIAGRTPSLDLSAWVEFCVRPKERRASIAKRSGVLPTLAPANTGGPRVNPPHLS